MSREHKLIALLSTIVILVLGLSCALVAALQWSPLAIATLLFVLSLLLSLIAVKLYQFWRSSLMDLTSFTQILNEGIGNVAPVYANEDGLISELQQEIAKLALKQGSNAQSSLVALSSIMDSWPIAICIFDQDWHLSYRNPAMYQQLKLPMLIGSSASDNGFEVTDNGQGLQHSLKHSYFGKKWLVQSASYQDQSQQKSPRQWLFCASDISQSLHQHESIIQQNLIRVFSHELRNSLTPMASMTDTLLCSDSLDVTQTRMVLNRINKRSIHLLEFIGRYADISQLAPTHSTWFDITLLVDEAKTVLAQDTIVAFHGDKQCFGDVAQLSMVLTNLFTNAQQAQEQANEDDVQQDLKISVRVYVQGQQQCVEVSDNGMGFANLDNALTPFYSTKVNGSGIGLALCREIIHQHSGELTLANEGHNHGALVNMSWPIVN